MATRQQRKHEPDQDEAKPAKLDALIRKGVLDALGQPEGLLQVQIKGLWENCYRVNVLVGPDIVSARIAHSYFLMADSAGKIVASTPPISRVY